MMRKKSFWLGMLTAFMLVFTMAFSDSASAAQPAKNVEKDYIVGFKSGVKPHPSKRTSSKRAAEKWTSSLESSTRQKRS